MIYTPQEMLEQIAQFEAKIASPSVDESRKKIYRQTVKKIKSLLAAAEQGATVETVQLPTTAKEVATKFNIVQQKETRPPSNAKEVDVPKIPNVKFDISPELPKRTMLSDGGVSVSFSGDGTFQHEMKPQNLSHNASDQNNAVISADFVAATRKMTIKWQDGYEFVGNEALIRSRFTSVIRDLVNSKLARQGRVDQLNTLTGYWRAIGFYKALTTIWGKAPSLKELGVSRPHDGELYLKVFQIICDASN